MPSLVKQCSALHARKLKCLCGHVVKKPNGEHVASVSTIGAENCIIPSLRVSTSVPFIVPESHEKACDCL